MDYKLKFLLSAFAGLLILQTSNAQLNKVGELLSGSKADAEQILSAYVQPYAKAFGADLNGGWYNTAKTHKLGGFDLTLSVSTAFVPAADKTYNVKDLNLITKPIITGNEAPTVAGKSSTRPELVYQKDIGGTKYTYATVKTPNGAGLGFIPAPMIQLGIGLIKETDITLRYLPDFNLADYGSVGIKGIGIKHSIKQWIPGIKHAPFFHLSFFGGYTQLKSKVNLDFKPSFYTSDATAITVTNKFDNQKMEMQVNGLTLNILASFDLPVVAFYGGVGISNTKTSLKLLGDYPVGSIGTGVNAGKVVVNSLLTNPLDIELKSTDGSATKPRLNVGVRFKLALMTIHFDYTYANYSVATAGLGLSFR